MLFVFLLFLLVSSYTLWHVYRKHPVVEGNATFTQVRTRYAALPWRVRFAIKAAAFVAVVLALIASCRDPSPPELPVPSPLAPSAIVQPRPIADAAPSAAVPAAPPVIVNQAPAPQADNSLLWGLGGYLLGRASTPSAAPAPAAAPTVIRERVIVRERPRQAEVKPPTPPARPPVAPPLAAAPRPSTSPRTFTAPTPSAAPRYGGPSGYASTRQSMPTRSVSPARR